MLPSLVSLDSLGVSRLEGDIRLEGGVVGVARCMGLGVLVGASDEMAEAAAIGPMRP